MSKRYMLALYNNFDEAEAVVGELRSGGIKGFDAACDLVVKSPIEHPEVEEFLGYKPVNVQWFTLIGSLAGGLLSFLLIAGSQAGFYAQMKGGKPIVPLPPDFVLTYEVFILGGVYMTVLGFLVCAGLPTRRSPLYSAKVSEDQIGLLVKVDDNSAAAIRSIFTRHKALEIQEEAGK